jgi:hypothetical protein
MRLSFTMCEKIAFIQAAKIVDTLDLFKNDKATFPLRFEPD